MNPSLRGLLILCSYQSDSDMSDEVATVDGTPEPVLNSGLQMMQMEEHAQLIESKSQMLDEVRSAVN